MTALAVSAFASDQIAGHFGPDIGDIRQSHNRSPAAQQQLLDLINSLSLLWGESHHDVVAAYSLINLATTSP
jgi:hypothetical protein